MGEGEMIEEQFCKRCEQKLPQDTFLNRFLGSSKVYKFIDGLYCEACARSKIKKHRGGK